MSKHSVCFMFFVLMLAGINVRAETILLPLMDDCETELRHFEKHLNANFENIKLLVHYPSYSILPIDWDYQLQIEHQSRFKQLKPYIDTLLLACGPNNYSAIKPELAKSDESVRQFLSEVVGYQYTSSYKIRFDEKLGLIVYFKKSYPVTTKSLDFK